MPHPMTSMPALPRRLDKFLRDSVGISRSACEAAWYRGDIEVDPPVQHPGAFVFPDADRVHLRGALCELTPATAYFALHKPAGVIATLDDPAGRRSLAGYLRDLPPRTFPVGRLDGETTGLLLMTDDGDLAHMVLHPTNGLVKTYELQVAGAVATDDPRLALAREGVTLDDGPARAVWAEVVEQGERHTRLSFGMDEGRNRIVRRLARRLRFELEHLHRSAIGPLHLGPQPIDTVRRLTDTEVESLWMAVGGRDAVRQQQISALHRRARHFRETGAPFGRLERWLEEHG